MIFKKIQKIALTTTSVLALSVLIYSKSYAALTLEQGTSAADNGGPKSLEAEVPKAVGVAMWAVGIISVVIIIFAGIMYATAAGDEAKVKKAKNALIGGVVGLAIAILATAIISFVQDAL